MAEIPGQDCEKQTNSNSTSLDGTNSVFRTLSELCSY